MSKNFYPGTVPDWAQDAVWYQIFPERFRNGCPQSNPSREDVTDHPIADWCVTPWGQDWYRPDAWAPKGKHGFWGMLARRYGGDLIGVRDKLDYIQDLGINAIYLNPIFMARSLHKYDGASFHHIDPTFGPDRAGDLKLLAEAKETEDPETWVWTAADRFFLELVEDVHARGMRIIIDGVFNHCGREFFAFQDVLANGKASRYADWFRIKRWKRDGSFTYEGWWGHQSLPEFNRMKDNLIQPVRDYIFNCTRRWMDPSGGGAPSEGIDGWRLDVAFCVPHGFWRDWRRHVKSINPDAYITAEIVEGCAPYLKGDQFDAVMNYEWLHAAISYFKPGEKSISMSRFKHLLERLRRRYPPEVMPVLQNLLDSHDVGRVSSVLENADQAADLPPDHFNVARVRQNPAFITTRPSERAWQSLRQLTLFQMTYLGAPMIYYGDEVGMWGANDPDNRQPMLWDDIEYEPETHGPGGKPLATSNSRQPDTKLLAFFRRAIRLRNENEVLRRGEFAWVKTGRRNLLGFERSLGADRICVLFNVSDDDVQYDLERPVEDVWNPDVTESTGTITVPARGWRVFR